MQDEPKVPGAPPEPEKPKTSGEGKPVFSFRDLELTDVLNVDGYRYLYFIVRGEYIVAIKEFEYYNYLSFIFEQLEFLIAEGEECTCDSVEPPFNVIEDNFKITAKLIDVDNNQVVKEEDRFIKVYDVYDLIPHTIVGGICKIDEQ